ncbi:MAG: tRNA (adenosine(37)-N6)-dimethylallyltransferase MiaA [Pseudomonadota bacterium]|nr:tRNA (adenosine(37)-N6)-dimethylallyltransferase MiaA [Pseudomonadota bacterium]
MSTKPVIIVCGPTASGKSGFAVRLAQRIGGEIVNADSMQVYRDLKIITARPLLKDQGNIPHHLYGVLGLADRSSAGTWRQKAIEVIETCHGAGSVPIVVGGTGFYIRTLMRGLDRMPSVPVEYRDSLNQRLLFEGAHTLHKELSAVDPELAKRLNPADGQRIVRGLEIFNFTGKRLSDWQVGETETVSPSLRFLLILISPEREALYEAIHRRFDRMIEAGAIEEVEKMLAAGPRGDYPPLRAVGVPAVRALLEGNINMDSMIDLGRRDTRRYAKRQRTWFGNQIIPDILIKTKEMESSIDKNFPDISKFLLTP